MNPIVLFDKSVFQETPASAFVAADRYIDIVVPPILVREIGGDLAASAGRIQREKDQRAFVAKLARRAGTRSFVTHHSQSLHHDLIGCPVPMDGRTPITMRYVPGPDGNPGLAAVETPEEHAMNRWRQGDFSSTDHLWASDWQRVQRLVRTNLYSRTLKKVGIEIGELNSLDLLQETVEGVIRNPAAQPKLLFLLFTDFRVPEDYQILAIKRFQSKKPRQLLSEFAPYACFCLKANLLLGFAGRDLIRPHKHDLRDLEYLYYLPFCEVFASEDKLHRNLAPLLARENQMILGRELGQDLKRLSDAWHALSPEEKIRFAQSNRNRPPENPHSIVRAIWERYAGPDTAHNEVIDPRPDQFFRQLLKKWGEEYVQETVEKPSFLLYSDQLMRQRAEELYPGVELNTS